VFSSKRRAATRLAKELIGLGYCKFVPASQFSIARNELIDSLAVGVVSTEWDEFCVSRDRRSYPADAEELAEGQIGQLLTTMMPVLRSEGVSAAQVEDAFHEDRYAVLVDGKEFFIHRPTSATASWTNATRRTLEIANEMLGVANSRERLYGVAGGNDGRVILLTREMATLLRHSQLIAAPEMPFPPAALRPDGSVTNDGDLDAI